VRLNNDYPLTLFQIPVSPFDVIQYALTLRRDVKTDDSETFYFKEEISKVRPILVNKRMLIMSYNRVKAS
jgi:hypothetical protein